LSSQANRARSILSTGPASFPFNDLTSSSDVVIAASCNVLGIRFAFLPSPELLPSSDSSSDLLRRLPTAIVLVGKQEGTQYAFISAHQKIEAKFGRRGD
jgi:hypothetical protein